MGDQVRTVRGVEYRPLAIVNPGDALFFTGTRRIAVETWALDWGQHEFDYEVNSRRLDNTGKPEAIATTERALAREFLERRAVLRQPIPVSVGFPNGLVPQIRMTMGEVAPQIYESGIPGTMVAWSLRFRHHRLVAAATGTMSSVKNGAVRNPNADAISRASVTGQAVPSGFDYLMVRVPVAEYARFRILRTGFGVTDLIGTEPGLIQSWIARITGR